MVRKRGKKFAPSQYTQASAGAYTGRASGLKLDKSLSNKNTKVFTTPDGKAIVSYRGTNPRNLRDLGTDALLSMGLLKKGTRYKHSVRDLDRAIAKYGKENVSTAGHSLGGSLAMAAGNRRGVKNVSFNPGYTPFSLLENRPTKKSTIYRTRGDPISASVLLTRKGKKRNQFKKTLNPHGIESFLT